KRRLADARAREDADTLAGAERREDVHDADAGRHRMPHRPALERRRGRGLDGARLLARGKRPRAVDRTPERVDHASLPPVLRGDGDAADPPDGHAGPGLGPSVVGLYGGALVVDAHHLAE